MVAAMVAHVMGATEEQILKDYERSDKYHMVALAGIDKQEELQALDKSRFERAPRESMQHALAHIQRKAGDIPAYLESFCGFSLQEQERLRQALSQPPLRNKL
jgi:protein tyrosine/serine phosphatase